jgi:subtilisin-like proprotein convertase family protein
MKKFIATALLCLAMCWCSSAAIIYSQTFNSGFQNNGAVPDGSLSGWSDTRFVNLSESAQITDLQVTLNISGGYNGDLYAYLVHGTGFAVLLNRVGVGQASGDAFGYANSGMSITLATAGAYQNIHSYGGSGAPSGTYLPDGRSLDPLSSPAEFDTASTGVNFGSMVGQDPNGGWTLFLSDVLGGGGQSTVTGWSLQLTAVPEPANVALAIFGLGLVSVGAFMRARAAKRRLSADSQHPFRRETPPQLPV